MSRSDQSAEAAWFQNMGFLELQSYAEDLGILDNSPAIQGVYIFINVFCSVRKSQQELVSMNCSVSVGVAVSALG